MATASGGKLTYGIFAYIEYSVSSTATTTTLSVTNAVARTNTASIGATNIGGSIAGTGQTTKSASGKTMKSSADVTIIPDFTWSWTRGTSAATKTITFKVTYAGGTSTASFTVSVPALASYTVSYSANGGSGAPSSQTKYYGKTLTLSSTKPTRTGYTFQNWKATNGTTYNAGASYTANGGTTMTAQWKANTYTVSYNANGGTGSIASQTKTYGKTLTLSNGSGFSWTNHRIVSWNTKADGSGTTYSLSQELGTTFSSALTLYAIWEITYIKPTISNVIIRRVASSGSTQEEDDGRYIYVSFDYVGGTLDGGETRITPTVVITIDGVAVHNALASGSPFTGYYSSYTENSSHTVAIKVYDSNLPAGVTASGSVSSATYPIDLLADGSAMGIMTTAKTGQVLTLAEAHTSDIILQIDENASSGTVDGDLYSALDALGWI